MPKINLEDLLPEGIEAEAMEMHFPETLAEHERLVLDTYRRELSVRIWTDHRKREDQLLCFSGGKVRIENKGRQ